MFQRFKNIPESENDLFELIKNIESKIGDIDINIIQIILYFVVNFDKIKDFQDVKMDRVVGFLVNIPFNEEFDISEELSDLLSDFDLLWNYRFHEVSKPISYEGFKDMVIDYIYNNKKVKEYFFED